MTEPAQRPGLRGPEIFGLLLIGLGALFLFDQLGLIRFGWNLLWPLIIIGIGVVVLVGALGTDRGRSGRGRETVHVPRDGADQLELELRVGAGRYSLRGGSVELVEAESRTDDIEAEIHRSDRRTRVRLALDRAWFPFSEHGTPDWRIAVGTDVATRLDIAAGAGDFDFDLSLVRLVDARVSIGAAQARITLPRPIGEVPIRISTGASQVTIAVPQGVEMQLRTSGGLLSVEGPVQSPGFATAADRVAVQIDGGATSIRVV